MLFRLKDETQTVSVTVAEEWTRLVAAACLNANEQPSLSPFSHLPNTQNHPSPPLPLSLPPPLHHLLVFLMFRIQPPICSTSPYLIVQNDTLTFYGEPIILSYTVHWLCEPTCPDQLGSDGSGGNGAVRSPGENKWWWGWGSCAGEVEGVKGLGWVARRLIVLSLTSPQGWSEQLETETAVLGRRRGRQRRARGRRGGNNTGGCCAEWRGGGAALVSIDKRRI